MAVIAQIGRDVGQVRRGVHGLEVTGEFAEVHHVALAVRGRGDGLEVHERIMPRRVLVAHLGALAGVLRAELGMPARRAHVFHVALPGLAGRAELPGDRGDRGRIHAAGSLHLPQRGRPRLLERGVRGAVVAGHGVGRLAGDLGQVVRVRVVGDPVVLGKQDALAAKRLREVGGLRAGTPHLVVALVLEIDHEHVPRLRRGLRGCTPGGGAGTGLRPRPYRCGTWAAGPDAGLPPGGAGSHAAADTTRTAATSSRTAIRR